MFRMLSSRTYFVCLSILSRSISVLLSGCSKKKDEPEQPEEQQMPSAIVLVTDSDEWSVQLFKEYLLYSEAVKTNLPAPWAIPTKEEATVLRTLEFASPSGERFITSDGYTFAMPSASVSKAGSKTKYSVLGLWKRKTTIDVPF